MSELKPWMVKYIRDPHPDYLPEDMGKTQLQASHAIAAAIEAELERTPEREPVGYTADYLIQSARGALEKEGYAEFTISAAPITEHDTPLFLAPPSDEAREANLMQFFEAVFSDEWDIADGGDLQDTAEALGLLVRVPADEQFRDEWGADEMLVWSWHPLARLDSKEE